ncbi:MAG TPA: hypothetical protein VMX56_02615, partial [Anaerolineales bacterium]|nr:hypothetical protein [Anaerolineales bacterium]
MNRFIKHRSGVIALFLSVAVSVYSQPSFSKQGDYLDNPGIEPVESAFMDVEGGRIFYEVFGNGFPLILIHDGLAHSVVWDAQAA